jgi:glucose-1-phosphate cytidylyltransferase
VGYKGEIIKDYFINYHPHTSDITADMTKGAITYGNSTAEDWIVNLADMGRATMTEGRPDSHAIFAIAGELTCLRTM